MYRGKKLFFSLFSIYFLGLAGQVLSPRQVCYIFFSQFPCNVNSTVFYGQPRKEMATCSASELIEEMKTDLDLDLFIFIAPDATATRKQMTTQGKGGSRLQFPLFC